MRTAPEHPFSNGTEGEAWAEVWCGECKHDHDMHDDQDPRGGCPLMLRAITGETNEEWEDWRQEEGYSWLPASIYCTQFEQCTDCDEHVKRVDAEGRTHRMWAAQMREHRPPKEAKP